jgi:hypothetical protein
VDLIYESIKAGKTTALKLFRLPWRKK